MRCATLLAACLILCCNLAVAQATDRDVLFQYSTTDALLEGFYDGELTVDELLKNGDLGVGTFQGLDGEMIVLDGRCYRVGTDGRPQLVPGSTLTPFAAVTFFDADSSTVFDEDSELELIEVMTEVLYARVNHFCAIRLDGFFRHVKVRSLPGQTKPYPKLPEVVAQQSVLEWRDIRGTLVGLRSPFFVRGTSIPGYHFHFISEDRTKGGHVLDCNAGSGKLSVDATTRLSLSLLNTREFGMFDFTDTWRRLEAIERGAE